MLQKIIFQYIKKFTYQQYMYVLNDEEYKNNIFIYLIYTLLSILQIFKKTIIIKNSKDKLKHNLIIKNKIIIFLVDKGCRFINCFNLRKIIIKDSKIIPKNSFRNCISLKHVFIDKNTCFIQSAAFKNCISLEKIYIPKTIQLIESTAFENCINLSKIIFY